MRTGPAFNDRHVLSDGTAVVLRHIRPADAGDLRTEFERLSPESRYRRFFGGVAHLSDEALRYLTDVDGRDHVAIVATTETPDLKGERGLGVARFVRLAEDPTVAEAAVTVVDDQQRKGLGRLLTTTLAEAARERGVHVFRAEVLGDNEPVLALLHDEGALQRSRTAGVATYDVPLDIIGVVRGPVDRLLRAAASSMAVLIRRLGPPGSGDRPRSPTVA